MNSFLEIMGVESICLREAVHLAKRSVKYWHLIGKLYGESVRDLRAAKVFRAAYFFCRHIDDVLDWDRTVTSDPEEYVYTLLHAMETGQRGPPILALYTFAIRSLKEMASEKDNPEFYFTQVIRDAMLFDYERAKNKKVLTREELERYYDATFIPVMNIALLIAGSRQRIEDIPEMITTQGHIYSVRDLKRDLGQGIVNIPQEELARAGLKSGAFSYESITRNPFLLSWMDNEIRTYQKELHLAKEKIGDAASRRVCSPLILQMEIYCALYRLGFH